jgi:SulP family sulfate permease
LKSAPKNDIIVMVITFGLTVIFDLVIAIEVGMILAAMLFMKRMSEETAVKGWKYVDSENDADNLELKVVPKNVRVYEISGPMFFGAADKILDIQLKEYTKCLVLRMRSVPAIDATAMNSLESLYKKCQDKDVTLVLSHVNEQPLRAMKKSGLYKAIGKDNFCPNIDTALDRANNI